MKIKKMVLNNTQILKKYFNKNIFLLLLVVAFSSIQIGVAKVSPNFEDVMTVKAQVEMFAVDSEQVALLSAERARYKVLLANLKEEHHRNIENILTKQERE